jgi:hypothetical protein
MWAPVYSFTHWLRLSNPPPPRIWAHNEGAIGQPRRHLFVTLWAEVRYILNKKIFNQKQRNRTS